MPFSTATAGIELRLAKPSDTPSIRAMQERSFAILGSAFYTPDIIAAFVATTGTMDNAVIDEGHYFVAVSDAGAIVASGGWSLRQPGYDRGRLVGVDDHPRSGAATVRSVFVDPALSRRGIASALMAYVESDASRHGIRTLRLMATLSGLAFYTRLGWRAVGEKAIALPAGLRFDCVSMSKVIAPATVASAPASRITGRSPAGTAGPSRLRGPGR